VLTPVFLTTGAGDVVLEAKPVRFVAVTVLGAREKLPLTQFALVVEQVKTFLALDGIYGQILAYCERLEADV
jgi:hypothetical protein